MTYVTFDVVFKNTNNKSISCNLDEKELKYLLKYFQISNIEVLSFTQTFIAEEEDADDIVMKYERIETPTRICWEVTVVEPAKLVNKETGEEIPL